MISDEEMRHLAKLSSLTMDNKELNDYKSRLEQRLTQIDQLSDIKADDIEPTFVVSDLETVWREDKLINYGATGDDLLALRPDSKDHMIKVPKVL